MTEREWVLLRGADVPEDYLHSGLPIEEQAVWVGPDGEYRCVACGEGPPKGVAT